MQGGVHNAYLSLSVTVPPQTIFYLPRNMVTHSEWFSLLSRINICNEQFPLGSLPYIGDRTVVRRERLTPSNQWFNSENILPGKLAPQNATFDMSCVLWASDQTQWLKTKLGWLGKLLPALRLVSCSHGNGKYGRFKCYFETCIPFFCHKYLFKAVGSPGETSRDRSTVL